MKSKLKPPPRILDWPAYEKRVRQLESEGMSRSDAQAVADAEIRQKRA